MLFRYFLCLQCLDRYIHTRRSSDLLHPDDAERARQVVAELGRGTTSCEAEFRINRPDGEQRWCVGTAAATTDKAGRVIRDRKSTRMNSSHLVISYAVFCFK